jgi:hypothetical protein
MKLSKVLRSKLIALFAMTAIFASLAFSMTASAESLVNFSRGILSNVSFAANTSQSATPEPTPPKRNEKTKTQKVRMAIGQIEMMKVKRTMRIFQNS